jgi:hypothetical protein
MRTKDEKGLILMSNSQLRTSKVRPSLYFSTHTYTACRLLPDLAVHRTSCVYTELLITCGTEIRQLTVYRPVTVLPSVLQLQYNAHIFQTHSLRFFSSSMAPMSTYRRYKHMFYRAKQTENVTGWRCICKIQQLPSGSRLDGILKRLVENRLNLSIYFLSSLLRHD